MDTKTTIETLRDETAIPVEVDHIIAIYNMVLAETPKDHVLEVFAACVDMYHRVCTPVIAQQGESES